MSRFRSVIVTGVGKIFGKVSHANCISRIFKRCTSLPDGKGKLMAPAIWEAVAFLVQAAKRFGEAVVQTATSVPFGGFADRRWVDVRRHNNLHTINP